MIPIPNAASSAVICVKQTIDFTLNGKAAVMALLCNCLADFYLLKIHTHIFFTGFNKHSTNEVESLTEVVKDKTGSIHGNIL